jgi:hypothetical protein
LAETPGAGTAAAGLPQQAAGSPSTAIRGSAEPAVLVVPPGAVRALWAALWALEDTLSAAYRLQSLPIPPPHVWATIEETQRQVAIVREVLGGLRRRSGGRAPRGHQALEQLDAVDDVEAPPAVTSR